MRAVNLIPAEERKAAGAGGRSGGAAYAVLGALAVLLLLATAYTLTGRTVDHRKAELAKVSADADSAEAQAAKLQSYTNFTSLREKRVATVRSIADSRFDWSHAMHELARVVPDDVWLTQLTGTVTDGVEVDNAISSQLRSAESSNPAIVVKGCTTTQDEVARMMTRLRLADGVTRVSLEASEKADDSGGGDGSAGSDADCRYGSVKYPQFTIVVFYEPAAASDTSSTTAPGATTPASSASGGTTAPASTTSTGPTASPNP